MTAASNGAWAESAGWGCESKSKPCLLGAKQAGPAPSRQGWRVPRHRFAACGLDRLSPARQGLAKQVRLSGKRFRSGGRATAFLANTDPLETSSWDICIDQKSPAASIFALRYD